MKKNIVSIMLCGALLLLGACGDDKVGSVYQIFDDNPASKTLEANEDYSEWVTILRYADLYNALNQATQAFTVLAPDNDAVNAFYTEKGVGGIEDLGREYARALIMHHTVLDSIQVSGMQMLSTLTNLSGDEISVEIDSVNAGQFVFGGTAHTIESGVHAYNALIYYVDAVMVPLVETVYDRLKANADYKVMTAAIDATGWDKALRTAYDTTRLETGGISVSRRSYTVLAVSDPVFTNAGVGSLADLVGKLGAGSDYTAEGNALNEFVAYHILKNNYSLDDLRSMSGSDTTRIWETAATDQVVMVTADTTNQDWILNLPNVSATPGRFVDGQGDQICKNGYVQPIDSWLPVWEPDPVTVVWDLADYIGIKNAVIEQAGAAAYQPAEPVTSETKVDVSKSGAVNYVVSESGVGGSTYAYVTYVNCKKNLKDCVNCDRLVFNLGYMGSATLTTPTIIRGKYKVEIQYVYLSDHSFMRKMTDGNGGMIRMTFDGENRKSATPYTSSTKSTAGVYEAVLYDELEFTSTTSHEFSFVVLDPTASTNSKFSLQFDCIKFTPIAE